MAAGDYVKRSNTSNTDQLNNGNGSTLDALWPTAVANVGSGISYNTSTGVFTLGETGHFLILCCDQLGTTDTTANQRTSIDSQIYVDGVSIFPYGHGTGYIRRTNNSQQCSNFMAAVVDIQTVGDGGDEVFIRHTRIDTSTAGTVNRQTTNSGIVIIKLDDNWNYARYQSSAAFAQAATDNNRVDVELRTTDEQDSVFTRTDDTIDIGTGNLVLAIASFGLDPATTTFNNRTEIQTIMNLAGSDVPGSWSQTYGPRASQGANGAGVSSIYLLNPTSGDDFIWQQELRDTGSETYNWFGSICLVELPAGAEACIVESTSQEINGNIDGVEAVWATNPYIDTDAFTFTANDDFVEVDVDDDYLMMAGFAVSVDAGETSTRSHPAFNFGVVGTPDRTCGPSCHNRSTGNSDHPAIQGGWLETGLSATDQAAVIFDRLSNANNDFVEATENGFALVRLGSLFAADTGNNVSLAATLGNLTSSANADVDTDVSLSATLGNLTSSANADVDTDVSLATTLGNLTSSGDLEAENDTTLAQTLQNLTGSGTIEVAALAGRNVSLDQTFQDLTSSSDVGVDNDVALAATLEDLSSSANVDVPNDVDLAATLEDLDVSANADVDTDITSAQTLENLTSSGTITVTAPGALLASLDQTFQDLTASSDVDVETDVSLAATLGNVSASGAIDANLALSVNQSLENLAASGNADVDTDASLAQSLEDLSSAGQADVDTDVSLTATLENLTLSANVIQELPESNASLDQTLQDLTSAADADVATDASVDASLEDLSATGQADVDIDASLDQSLEDLVSSGSSTVDIDASLAAQLENLVISAAGSIGEGLADHEKVTAQRFLDTNITAQRDLSYSMTAKRALTESITGSIDDG